MAKMSKKTKGKLISALHTFISSFAVVVIPFLSDMDWTKIEQSAVIAVILTGVRAGVKAVSVSLFPQE